MHRMISQRNRLRPREIAARLGPWSASLLLHLGLIALGFALTWSIIQYEEQLPSPVIASNVVVLTPTMPLLDATSPSEQTAASIDLPDLPQLSTDVPSIAGPAPAVSRLQAPATFAGSSMQAARDVVFVVDASGSMMAWVFAIIDEVERSLSGMSGQQRFAVLCFAGDTVWRVPRNGLTRVTPDSIRGAVSELRSGINALSGFGSDPVAALQSALTMRPDLIMLWSEGIEGRGRFTVDREAALKTLDRLNPSPAGGARPVAISCIQLTVAADQVPAVLMSEIAEAHGGTFNTIASEDFDP